MASRRKSLVLVVDDESDIRSSLRMILEYEGYGFAEASSGEEALAKLESERPDALVVDIKMPRMDGLEILARVKQSDPSLPVIVVSGHGTIATAVEATHLGAFDFMEKPLERDRVLLVLRNALASSRLERENRDLKLSFEEKFRLVADAPAMKSVHEQIALAAPTKASVLITGESGTGKELVARAVHRNSPRASKAFVRVNCAAIPEELIESELFGHEKGSFTGALRDQAGKFVQADGGTIFLDEIGDMSLKTQAKVLRVLQDGEVEPVGAAKSFTVDVRVIAATNKDLPAEIRRGAFREDLYYRLNVVPITIPPLRRRREEIPGLVRYFAAEFCRENTCKTRSFSGGAIATLQGRPWRGNVRELKNAVERLLIMTDSETIEVGEVERLLPAEDAAAAVGAARAGVAASSASDAETGAGDHATSWGAGEPAPDDPEA